MARILPQVSRRWCGELLAADPHQLLAAEAGVHAVRGLTDRADRGAGGELRIGWTRGRRGPGVAFEHHLAAQRRVRARARDHRSGEAARIAPGVPHAIEAARLARDAGEAA